MSSAVFDFSKNTRCVDYRIFGNQRINGDFCIMYIKTIRKYCTTERTTHTYFRLCESYRDEWGKTRQRMVLGLGKLEEIPDIDQQVMFIKRINQLIHGKQSLFEQCGDAEVEKLSQHYYQLLKSKNKLDNIEDKQSDLEKVKLHSLKNQDVRELGAESLCLQAFRQLRIDKYLSSRGWGEEQVSLAATHVISRAVYPASEYKTVSWIKENSSVCELTGCKEDNITKDKLYGISKKLYTEKEGLENHLSRYTCELFNLEDNIILYDLTNTYFEGRMKDSKIAKFGRSKEKRSDARLIVLAVVINPEGFLKHSDIFEGSASDCSTLKSIVEKLDKRVGSVGKKPVIVMDAGIATESNIQFLKEGKYDYLCVSRSNLKEYIADTKSIPLQIKDKRGQPIELLKVRVENDTDHYLWVKSEAKAMKETSMASSFSMRFEEGLRGINNSINNKGGTKRIEKVWERLGRLKEKFPSVHQDYEIKISDNGKGLATGLVFEKKKENPKSKNEGIYFLRTSLDGRDEQSLWRIYNAIREIEHTFRVLKTDLDLRPIFHKTDDASMAHLHLGLLAYWLVSTIRYQLKIKGIHHEWSEIVRIMNTHKRVTTTMENDKEQLIKIRQCSEPNDKVKQIYTSLRYNPTFLSRKKSVWHTGEILKKSSSDYQVVMDG